MLSDTISWKSSVQAEMGPLFGEGGRADASGELVHLRSAAPDRTEQLSKETGGHARSGRWSWVQGMWAFHFQVEVLQFTESTYNSGGRKLESIHMQPLPLLRTAPKGLLSSLWWPYRT